MSTIIKPTIGTEQHKKVENNVMCESHPKIRKNSIYGREKFEKNTSNQEIYSTSLPTQLLAHAMTYKISNNEFDDNLSTIHNQIMNTMLSYFVNLIWKQRL